MATPISEQDKHKAIIKKIRKILQLSRSANEHEAAAATAKAMELLAKYNLEMASVTQDGDNSQATCIRRKTRQRLEDWAYALAGHTSNAFDCNYYHGRGDGETVFIGVGADPEVCGWMYSYLYKTLLRLASAHMKTECRRLRSIASKKQARASFLWGAVAMIAAKLRQQKKELPVTSDALVPVKKTLIAAAMPANLSTSSVAVGKIREKDWRAGHLAASSVPLSTPIKGSPSQRIALG